MSVNLDDFSMRVGTIIANLDVVFRDISEIRGMANLSLSQNAETALRIAVLENQQKAVQEIKVHLSTLVPLSNTKLEVIEHSFDEIRSVINKVEAEILIIKGSVEAVKAALTTDLPQFKTAVDGFKTKNEQLLTALTTSLTNINNLITLVTTIKTQIDTEPTVRGMLLELSHKDEHGHPWAWTKQIRSSLEYNFWSKIGEILLVLLAFGIYKAAEYYYTQQGKPAASEIQALKDSDASTKKTLDDMQKNQQEILKLLSEKPDRKPKQK